jgi:hypothetical protein
VTYPFGCNGFGYEHEAHRVSLTTRMHGGASDLFSDGGEVGDIIGHSQS